MGFSLIATLAARMDRKSILIWLMVAFAAGKVASSMAASYPQLLVARFLSGAAARSVLRCRSSGRSVHGAGPPSYLGCPDDARRADRGQHHRGAADLMCGIFFWLAAIAVVAGGVRRAA